MLAAKPCAGLWTVSKGSSPPEQNQTRECGASRSACASKSPQTTTDGPMVLRTTDHLADYRGSGSKSKSRIRKLASVITEPPNTPVFTVLIVKPSA
ncbi:hypothetical protein SFRURICE_007033 [Spodoptera frugiperda]|nr:hypothetical protein SFRURICE_007033 [Spodoptera frugiperda]